MLADTFYRPRLYKGFDTAFFALALLCVALPGSASIKAVMIMLTWLYLLINDGFEILSALWFFSVVLNLELAAGIGAVVRAVAMTDVVNHFIRLFMFFIVLGIGGYVTRRYAPGKQRLDDLIFYTAFLMMLFKVGIMCFVLTGLFSLELIQGAIGFESVTEDIGFGLQRLQFPADIVIPFLIVSYVGGKSRIKDSLLLVSAAIVILLSFSRYLFAFYLVCTFLRALWLRRIDLISICSMAVILASTVLLFDNLLARFASAETQVSDDIRVEQIRHITRVISDFPLLGTGVGSSVATFKRSETTPYFYEAQWYAMTMQFGFVGIIWFFVNLLGMLYSSVKRKNILFFTIVFLGWAVSGLTNPFITALGSAFGLCVLLFRCNGDPKIDGPVPLPT